MPCSMPVYNLAPSSEIVPKKRNDFIIIIWQRNEIMI